MPIEEFLSHSLSQNYKFIMRTLYEVSLMHVHDCKIAGLPVLERSFDPCDPPKYCDHGTSIPDPKSCFGYLMCANGNSWTPVSCPSGSCFDVNQNACLADCTCLGPCSPKARSIILPGKLLQAWTCPYWVPLLSFVRFNHWLAFYYLANECVPQNIIGVIRLLICRKILDISLYSRNQKWLKICPDR